MNVANGPRRSLALMGRTVAGVRYLVLAAVAGTLVIGTAVLVAAIIKTAVLVVDLASTSMVLDRDDKQLTYSVVALLDLYLLSTVVYVIAIGLYELFVDDTLNLPAWLEIHSLDDLKNKLIAMVITILAVAFLGQVIGWDGQSDLLRFGAPVAMVIAALTWFLTHKAGKAKTPPGDDTP